MLYQPSSAEIEAVIARSLAKHGNAAPLAVRLERARTYLEQFSSYFSWYDGAWEFTQAADERADYTVSWHACTCPDAKRQRDLISGIPFCKHRLALLAYREICGDAIRQRLLPAGVSYRVLRLDYNAAVIARGDQTLACLADYNDKITTVICGIRYTNRALLPALPVDLHLFSEWLAQARPLSNATRAELLYREQLRNGRTVEEAAQIADALLFAAENDLAVQWEAAHAWD